MKSIVLSNFELPAQEQMAIDKRNLALLEMEEISILLKKAEADAKLAEMKIPEK